MDERLEDMMRKNIPFLVDERVDERTHLAVERWRDERSIKKVRKNWVFFLIFRDARKSQMVWHKAIYI